jgi:Domain of unknown function DUF11
VIRARIRRLAAVVSVTVVASVMFAGVATAAPPNWVMTVTKLPPAVSPGAPAGYQIDITNNGPSNISALYLVDNIGATPVYLSTTQGTCNATGSLFCSFGALNDDQSVTVVVAFDTPTSGTSFAVTFQANTSGSTFSDVKNRSHGDLLTQAVSTALSNNKNYAGFFSTITDTGIGNSDQLSGNNKQSTRLAGLPPGLAGTVQDGSVTPDACTTDLDAGIDCSLIDGETSVVTVGTGGNVDDGFFIIIHYKNGSTPTAFVHTYGAGLQEKINECGPTPAAPCFTWDAATTTATIYTLHNGSYTKLH